MEKNHQKRPVLQTRHRASRHRGRIFALQAGLVAMFGLLAWRIHYVQHSLGPSLLASADKIENQDRVELAPRGELLDANGNQLSYDVPAFYMDIEVSAFASDLSALVQLLSGALGVPQSQVSKQIESKFQWVRWSAPIMGSVKDKVSAAFAALKNTSQSQAVTFTPTEERFYPYGSFAANTIGFVGQSGVGESGLEQQYNSVLAGSNGQIDYTQDAMGFPIPSTEHVVKAPVAGDNVELTLNQTIQGYVEHEMDSLVSQYKPEHAAIIVTNPKTGAILAMSSRPTYDPNHYAQASSEALDNNWAVNSRFEPGSTFKAVVLAAALATNSISLDDTFMSGHKMVAGTPIYDWNGVGWGVLTFQQALEYSSNVGFATIALKLGWANMLHYIKLFGFTHPTGVDLPAEASSLLFPPSEQGPVQLATTGFGQGISVTPLQQMAAYGAIANGGSLMKPYLAKAILSPSGKVLKSIQPTVVAKNLLPQNVIDQVNNSLVLDVSKGIDSGAIIKGYDVAGKTGTAQIADPQTGQYYNDRFVVSFLGYAPAENPVVEVYVTVYWPKAAEANTWGSTIATPTAQHILKDCLEYFHVPPNGDAASLNSTAAALAPAAVTKYVETPNLVGMTSQSAAVAVSRDGLSLSVIGTGGTVKRQWPAVGTEVAAGTRVFPVMSSQATGHVNMPNLTGLSMRDAGNLLAALGLQFVPQGSGYVGGQSIPAGQLVATGSTVTVTFAQPTVSALAAAAMN